MQQPHKNGSASKLRFKVVRLKTYHCNPVERGLGSFNTVMSNSVTQHSNLIMFKVCKLSNHICEK